MANAEFPNRRDTERDSGAQPERNRPDSITQEGKDINTTLSHEQRMNGVETSAGRQGSDSNDYDPNKPVEDRGGYGMQDTDRRPGDYSHDRGDDETWRNAQHGAAPVRNSRYDRDEDRARGSVSAQPGQENAGVKDEHPERPGHDTSEGKAENGQGNDERGDYGRGVADAEQPETTKGQQ